jgi:hypothetical protein
MVLASASQAIIDKLSETGVSGLKALQGEDMCILLQRFADSAVALETIGEYLSASAPVRAIPRSSGDTSGEAGLKLMDKMSKVRLPPSKRFLLCSDDLKHQDLDHVIQVAGVGVPGSKFTALEVSFRAALLLSDQVTEEMTAPGDLFGEFLRVKAKDVLESTVLGSDETESAVAAGMCLLTQFAQKPFVAKASQGFIRAITAVSEDILFSKIRVSSADLESLNVSYVSRMNLGVFLEAMAAQEYRSSVVLDTICRRFTSGCTHLQLITTAMALHRRMPFWSYVPTAEREAYTAAADMYMLDPLFLHPHRGYPAADTAEYRATAMPTLVTMSMVVLITSGHHSWLGYMNRPFVVSVAGVPANSFFQLVAYYIHCCSTASLKKLISGMDESRLAPIISEQDIEARKDLIQIANREPEGVSAEDVQSFLKTKQLEPAKLYLE